MYNTLIVEPFLEVMARVGAFIPTLLIALFILIIGGLIVYLVDKLLSRLFKTIDLDKIAGKIGVSDILKKGGVKYKFSELVIIFIYWILTIAVLFMTLKALGFTMVSALADKVLAYIPDVISGAVILIVGLLVAKVVSGFIYFVAKTIDAPLAEGLSTLSKMAIVIYVAIMYLKEVGFFSLFVGLHYTILLGGVVLALAIAFGLAGRDIASKYLDVFGPKKNGH